jgi:acetyl esterase/lipase
MPDRMDVAYHRANDRDLKLDIYEPGAGHDQRTAVLLVHGGGWRRGDRTMLAAHARLLSAQGFTAIACEYRLLGESPWPAALEDVRAAIAWVRANADDLGIESGRIVLQGNSAGGHLSLLAAGTADAPRPVAAVVAIYPPTTFHVGDVRGHGTIPARELLGDAADAAAAAAASPLTYVAPDFPPTFFVHGGADRIVPPSASIVMYDALRTAGVQTDLHIFAGQHHAFDRVGPFREVVSQEVGLFVRRMVSERDELAERVLAENDFAAAAASAAGV